MLHRKPASSRHRERMPVDPYTRAPVTYVQLLQHIRRARDVRALEALVDAHGARFDAVHASAAMAALPRVLAASAVEQPTPEGSRRPAELLARLQAMALQNRERMQARQIANAVWSAGRCRQVVSAAARDERRRAVGAQRVPASALLQAGEMGVEEGAGAEGATATGGGSSDAAAEAAGAASPVATAAQLLALEREQARARLRQRRSQAALPRWRGDAAGAALASLPTSSDLDAGPAAASRAAVRELLAELGRGGFRKLYQGGAPADAAQLLHGLARLRLAPPPSLLRHLQAFVAKRSAEFDARHLAVSAWALSRLAGLEREKQQQRQGGGGAARPARRAEAGVAAPLPGPLAEMIVARALEQADFFRPWSACALLYAFARPVAPRVAAAGREEEEEGGEPPADYRALGRALAEGLARVVVAEADARAPTPQQMASLAWAYGRLGVWGGGGGSGGGGGRGESGGNNNNDTVAASLARCALDSLDAFGPTDLSLLLSGLAESAAAGVREGALAPGQPLPRDVARLLAAVASGIAEERAVRLASAEDAARLLRGYATFAGKGLYAPQDAEEAEALEGMALRLAGGAAAHARGATARTARELATLLPRLLLRRGGFGRRGLAGEQEGEAGGSVDADAAAAVEAATADLLRAAGSAELAAAAVDEESGARRATGFAGTEAADLLDVLADAHASSSGGRARREPDARLLAALLQARGALALPPHDELCRQAAACLSALSARVQELAGAGAGAGEVPTSSSSSSPLLRPLEQATDLAAGLAEARRLGAESGAAAARAALAASASSAEPKPKLRTLARLCRALSSDVAVMQQPPVRSLLEACAGPFDAAAAATAEGGGLPAGAAASAAVALARAIRHGHAPATSRDLALRLADAADEQGRGDPLVARDVDEARGLLVQAGAATGA